MSSVNKVILVGRLGQDPELKQVGTGSVCKFSVATSEKWNDKQGQKQERTEWTTVEIWGKPAENCAKYLSKGKLVYVEGKLRTDKSEKDGQTRYFTSVRADNVTFLSSGNAQQQQQSEATGPSFGANEEVPF